MRQEDGKRVGGRRERKWGRKMNREERGKKREREGERELEERGTEKEREEGERRRCLTVDRLIAREQPC